MSKELAQTVRSRRIATVLFAILSCLLALGFYSASAADPTPTPVPAPILGITKTVLAPTATVGDLVGFTVTVTNRGNADSGRVVMQDSLPAGLNWVLGASTFDSCSVDAGVLICTSESIERRHVNEAETDFENGSAYVDIWAVPGTCGLILNNALLISGGKVLNSGLHSINVLCPVTPTPVPATPTPVPPTPTLAPTQTPVEAVTPIIIVKYATPRPPNTGTGIASADTSNVPIGFGAVIIMAGLVTMGAVARKRRRTE